MMPIAAPIVERRIPSARARRRSCLGEKPRAERRPNWREGCSPEGWKSIARRVAAAAMKKNEKEVKSPEKSAADAAGWSCRAFMAVGGGAPLGGRAFVLKVVFPT